MRFKPGTTPIRKRQASLLCLLAHSTHKEQQCSNSEPHFNCLYPSEAWSSPTLYKFSFYPQTIFYLNYKYKSVELFMGTAVVHPENYTQPSTHGSFKWKLEKKKNIYIYICTDTAKITQHFIISTKLHVAIETDHQEAFSTNLQKRK